jgi:hypothetical protein
MGVALYSTNPWVSYMIAERYRGNIHRVWCGEVYDPRKEPSLSLASAVPPSSSPAQIYKRWAEELQTGERHSLERDRVKATLSSLAVRWCTDGSIEEGQRDEILYALEQNDSQLWRPLLYVIPRTPQIAQRLLTVPPAKRAGLAPEYILEDLRREEFDVLEF